MSTQAVNLRRPALRASPLEGESLTSLIARSAYLAGMSICSLLATVGIAATDRTREFPRAYGIQAPDDPNGQIHHRLGLPAGWMNTAVLLAYQGRALKGRTAKEIATMDWWRVGGAPECPACVAESGGARQLTWRYALHAVCRRHGTVLATTCPGCGIALGGFRGDGTTTPAYPGSRQDPARCTNFPAAKDGGGHGGVWVPCGFDPARITCPSADQPALLAQQEIERLLDNPTIENASARDRLEHIRSIMALLLRYPAIEIITEARGGELPGWAIDAVEAQQQKIAKARERVRSYLGTPATPALVAATLPAAVALLDAPAEQLQAWLAPIVQLSRKRRGSHTGVVASDFSLPETIASAWKKQVAQTGSQRRVARPAHRAAPRRRFGIESVPQLIFEPEVEQLAGLFATKEIDRLRERLAIAVLAHEQGLGWGEAGEAFGIPAKLARERMNWITSDATAAGASEQLTQNIASICDRIAAEPQDWKHRRRIADEHPYNDGALWRSWAPTADIKVFRPYVGMHATASALVWARIAGRFPADAPAWPAALSQEVRVEYIRRLRIKLAAAALSGLDEMAEQIITRTTIV